jgi:hypothetical protein
MRAQQEYLGIGPGGRKCACCFPAPGSKSRKAAYRTAKRKEWTKAKQEMTTELVCYIGKGPVGPFPMSNLGITKMLLVITKEA